MGIMCRGPVGPSPGPESGRRYYSYRSFMVSAILVLGLSYAVANPVILINGGLASIKMSCPMVFSLSSRGGDIDPTVMDCSQQTPEYDSKTQLTTYRCKPVVKNNAEKIYVADTDDNDGAYSTRSETMIMDSSNDSKDEINYKFVKSGLSKRRRKNRKNRKSKNNRRNKSLNLYDRMVSDAPMKEWSELKRSKNDVKSGSLLSVGKFDIKNRCGPGELYISELHICLPHDNKLNRFNIYDHPQADALPVESKYYKYERQMPLEVGKFEGNGRCGSGEVYISELDICLPHDNKLVQFSMHDKPQGDASVIENNEGEIPLEVGKFDGKGRCGSGEVYVSELDICLPHDNKLVQFSLYDKPQRDMSVVEKNEKNIAIEVGKFQGRRRCGSGEVYLSELDICLPHENKLVQFSIYDKPQKDAQALENNDKNILLKVGEFLGKDRCGSGEVYVSELDVCLPHENKLAQFSIYDSPQGDMLAQESEESIERIENEKMEETLENEEMELALESEPVYSKSRCGEGELYQSELDICIPHKI